MKPDYGMIPARSLWVRTEADKSGSLDWSSGHYDY